MLSVKSPGPPRVMPKIRSNILKASIIRRNTAKKIKVSDVRVDQVEFNLKLLERYNTPLEPLSANFKAYFNGDYAEPEYSIIRYNVVSSLFLLVVPMLFMLGILMFLQASFKVTVIVLAIFGVFTILPIFLI